MKSIHERIIIVDRGRHRVYFIIQKIGSFRGEWFGVGELARATKLAPSTIHHQLSELVTEGYVETVRGKYRSRYATISLLVTVESITMKLQEQGIEPTAEVLAAVIAQMRAAASLAADDALNDFIVDCIEDENSA